MKKIMIKLTVMIMVFALFTTNLCHMPVKAAEIDAGKEEVIYVKLDGDGGVTKVYAVNIFEGGSITDYGNYSEVKNLNTMDDIQYENNTVKMIGTKDKVYYQGTMKEAELPWKIEITYEIDGKKYLAGEMAGKSGDFKLTIKITENKKAKEGFFEAYALQISAQFDAALFQNIEAQGATIANAGKMKQLAMTVLPGKEKEFVITGYTSCFELDSISMNGVNLELGIDKESFDTASLYEKTDEIKDAAGTFDEGAGELKDGAVKLNDGAGNLQSGVNELNDGITEYTDGAYTLKEGIDSLQSGNLELESGAEALMSGTGSLVSGAAELKNQSAQFASKVSELNETVKSMNIGGVSLTSEQIAQIKAAASSSGEIASAASALSSGIANSVAGEIGSNIGSDTTVNIVSGALQQAVPELDGGTADALAAGICAQIAGQVTVESINNAGMQNGILSALQASAGAGATAGAQAVAEQVNAEMGAQGSGIEELKSAISQISSAANALSEGIASLYNGASELNTGAISLYQGAGRLSEGSNLLQEGSQTLVDNSSGLLDGAQELTKGALELNDATSKLLDGTTELKDGTTEFAEEAETINDVIDEELEHAISGFTGGDYEITSFVSDRNTKVDSVQFVISTDSIEVAEEETVEEVQPEKPSFWEKLIHLFK